jgi:hypothetical protein
VLKIPLFSDTTLGKLDDFVHTFCGVADHHANERVSSFHGQGRLFSGFVGLIGRLGLSVDLEAKPTLLWLPSPSERLVGGILLRDRIATDYFVCFGPCFGR